MSGALGSIITCPACGKRYAWQVALAGHKVKCKCGQVMRMPNEEPAAESRARPPAGPLGGKLAEAMNPSKSAVTQSLEAHEDEVKASPMREHYLPLILLVIGVGGVYVACASWAASRGGSIAMSLLGATAVETVQLFIFLPLAFAVLISVGRLMEFPIGGLWATLRKLVGVTLGTGALGDILFFTMMTQIGFDWEVICIAFMIYLVMCGIPMAVMFEFGVHETFMIVILLALPRLMLLIVLGAYFEDLFFP